MPVTNLANISNCYHKTIELPTVAFTKPMEVTASYLSKYNANLDCLINSEANQFTDPEWSIQQRLATMNVKDGKLFMWSTCRTESMSTRILGMADRSWYIRFF